MMKLFFLIGLFALTPYAQAGEQWSLRGSKLEDSIHMEDVMHRNLEDESETETYQCIFDPMDLDTMYLPPGVSSFNVRLSNRYLRSLAVYSFPNGFGQKELISGRIMTLDDLKEEISDVRNWHLIAIQEYVEGELPTVRGKSVIVCPAFPTVSPSNFPSAHPTAYPSAQPSASFSPTASPSTMPSSTPSTTPTNTPSTSPVLTGSQIDGALQPITSDSDTEINEADENNESDDAPPSAPPTEPPSTSPPSISPTTTGPPSISPSDIPSVSPTDIPSIPPHVKERMKELQASAQGPKTPGAASSTNLRPGPQDPSGAPADTLEGATSEDSADQPGTEPPPPPGNSASYSMPEVPSSVAGGPLVGLITPAPSTSPTISPSAHPSTSPTQHPSVSPTGKPSLAPSGSPTSSPSDFPSLPPITRSSASPTYKPTQPRTTPPTSNVSDFFNGALGGQSFSSGAFSGGPFGNGAGLSGSRLPGAGLSGGGSSNFGSFGGSFFSGEGSSQIGVNIRDEINKFGGSFNNGRPSFGGR